MAGENNKITQASRLLFKWRLELSDGQVKENELPIRADHAFERGVHMPKDWKQLCVLPFEAAASHPFTVTAAREAAKSATCEAKRKLDKVCTSVLCRRSLLHSLLSTCRFELFV